MMDENTMETANAKDKNVRVHELVNAGPLPGMSEAFDAHMGTACWTDPAYAPAASMWAAAWRAAKTRPETQCLADLLRPACRYLSDVLASDAPPTEKHIARTLMHLLPLDHVIAELAQPVAQRDAHTLAHALKVLLCDDEAADYMTGREREMFARQALVDFGA